MYDYRIDLEMPLRQGATSPSPAEIWAAWCIRTKLTPRSSGEDEKTRRSARTTCQEDELSAGPVGRVADLVHNKTVLNQRGLDLLALAKAQSGVRGQHATIREYPCPVEGHQRQADVHRLDPVLDRQHLLRA